MIWITSDGKHLTISQMSDSHLENCINKLMRECKPSEKVYNKKSTTWVKEMSKELTDREIAKVQNKIEDIRRQNKALKKEFDEQSALLEELNLLRDKISSYK